MKQYTEQKQHEVLLIAYLTTQTYVNKPIVCSGDRLCDVKRHVRTGHTTDIDTALEKRTRVTLSLRIWS